MIAGSYGCGRYVTHTVCLQTNALIVITIVIAKTKFEVKAKLFLMKGYKRVDK
jgi:hypothetical protein